MLWPSCHIHPIFKRDSGQERFKSPGGEQMLDQESQDYFRRRERAERAAAKSAISDAARRAHQELAQSYADLLRRS